MKHIVIVWAMFIALYCSGAQAALISYGGEEIVKVMDLPNSEQYQMEDGTYIDLGYIYKSVSIFYIPVWNYDGRLVGTTGREKEYLEITPDMLMTIGFDIGYQLPERPYLDFWQRIGGKLVLLAVIGFIAFQIRQKAAKKAAFLSEASTPQARLKDILFNSQEFVELEPASFFSSGTPEASILAMRTYFNSFITLSVFDMNQVDVTHVMAKNEAYFEQLLSIKGKVEAKSNATIHYVYFMFDKSPTEAQINQLKGLRKRKIRQATHLLPGIIDCEKHTVDCVMGAMPSKKIIANCFTQKVMPLKADDPSPIEH